MPEIKEIQIRDVHVTFSMSLEEMKQIRRALNLAEIDVRKEDDPRNAPAVSYLTQVFYPFLDDLIKDAEKYVT